MTTNELIKELQDRLPRYYRNKYSSRELKMILSQMYAVVMMSVAMGEQVQMREFGTFYPSRKKMAIGIGVSELKEHVFMRFRPARGVKKFINAIANTPVDSTYVPEGG